MSIDLNFEELGTLAKMVEDRAKAELDSVVSRLSSAGIGELATLFSEGLSVANKWEALHAKMQAAANAPAPAEPVVEEQPTEVLPTVPSFPDAAQPAEDAPAAEAPAEEAAQ